MAFCEQSGLKGCMGIKGWAHGLIGAKTQWHWNQASSLANESLYDDEHLVFSFAFAGNDAAVPGLLRKPIG